MSEQEIKLLVENLNRFHFNKVVDNSIRSLSDKEYDALADRYEDEYGESVLELITFAFKEKIPNPIRAYKARKEFISLGDTIPNMTLDKYWINYKYDGTTVAGIYDENGRLTNIISTPGNDIVIDRTQRLKGFFPSRIYRNLGVRAILGEALVDAEIYKELSRNKASGLVNSVHVPKEEVESELFIRIWDLKFHQEPSSLDRLRSTLFSLNFESCIDTKVAERLPYDTRFISTIVTESGGSHKVQVDGLVRYFETSGVSDKVAYKAHFTESAEVVIKDIEYNEQGNGSFIPKLIFDTVKLQGKSMSRCATGGIKELRRSGAGIGSICEVAFHKLSTPGIVRVITRSEDYGSPKCGCGCTLDLSHDIGGVIKCTEPECSVRRESFNKRAGELDPTSEEYLFDLLNIMNIDRYKFSRKNYTLSSTKEFFTRSTGSTEPSDTRNLIFESFKVTPVAKNLIDLYSTLFHRVLRTEIYSNPDLVK